MWLCLSQALTCKDLEAGKPGDQAIYTYTNNTIYWKQWSKVHPFPGIKGQNFILPTFSIAIKYDLDPWLVGVANHKLLWVCVWLWDLKKKMVF